MCDCLVALGEATANGHTLFAKNSDRPPTEAQVIEFHPANAAQRQVRCTHIAVEVTAAQAYDVWLSRPEWCWGAEHGMNSSGVAIGNETIYTTRDPRLAPAALTGLDLVRLALTWSGSAPEAVAYITALLAQYGQGGTAHDPAVGKPKPYWSSFLVADPMTAFVVETSGRDYEIEPVSGVRAISNRTTIPSFDAAHRHPSQPVDTLVDPRWRASQNMLSHKPVTIDLLQAHLRSHGQTSDGWDICMHTERECTTASMVAELPANEMPVAWMLTGSPCQSTYERFTFANSREAI